MKTNDNADNGFKLPVLAVLILLMSLFSHDIFGWDIPPSRVEHSITQITP